MGSVLDTEGRFYKLRNLDRLRMLLQSDRQKLPIVASKSHLRENRALDFPSGRVDERG